ncbi:MAG: helix-hairpin-helix domain-containing protein [Oscillospiraceae bacterium]|nr:helix-hairpin-helix domain-containing protein [Oscillospiraceae bacterium]
MKTHLQKRIGTILWAAAAVLLLITILRLTVADRAPAVSISTLDTSEAAISSSAGLLDINTATAEELEALPGIGPVLAERIIAWREENGPFTSREDVLDVYGIGQATYEKLEPYINFG